MIENWRVKNLGKYAEKNGMTGEHAGHYNKPHTEETKKIIGLCSLGRIESKITRLKKSKNSLEWWKINKNTPKEIMRNLKISESLMGGKHSDEHNMNYSITMRQKYASGEIVSWSKGLTKETDKRLMNTSINASLTLKRAFAEGRLKCKWLGTKKSDDEKKKISERTKMAMSDLSLRIMLSEIKKKDYAEGKISHTFKSGEKHPNWCGGISSHPYPKEFDKFIKESIRIRDWNTCQICEKWGVVKLSIHHIDYNKLNNFNHNLISLCKKCHAKTNFNRETWVKFLQIKIFSKELFNPQNLVCC